MLLSIESRALNVGLEPLNLASFGIVVLLLAFALVLVATLAVLLDPLLCEGPLFFVPKVGIQMSKAPHGRVAKVIRTKQARQYD